MMYTPKYFKVTDVSEIWNFVQTNSFGTIVSTINEKPIATHLPLQLVKEADTYYLTGHMAYGNSQWRTFDTCDEVLIIFQGPHAYISSSWYEEENVPTWNYQAVHLYGKAQILSENELIHDLTTLLQKYEGHRENPVLWDNLSSQTKKQIQGIVGFKIKIQEVQASYKLSQNRNEADYNNIISNLFEEKDFNSSHLAGVMKDRKSFD